MGVKNPSVAHGRVRDNIEKQLNEKPPMRSKTTTNVTKISWRFSQASTITGSFVEPTFD